MKLLTLHNKLLKSVVKERKKDKNVLCILLFGSLASGKAHKKSDIDIELICKNGKYKETHKYKDGIKIDFEICPKKKIIERLKRYPFLFYPYLKEKILYDPTKFAKNLKKKVKIYFKNNKKVLKEWKIWEKEYFKAKKLGKKIKDVNKFYNELKKRLK